MPGRIVLFIRGLLPGGHTAFNRNHVAWGSTGIGGERWGGFIRPLARPRGRIVSRIVSRIVFRILRGVHRILGVRILVVSVDDGHLVYSATEIDLSDLEDGVIQPPGEGQETSRDEYEKIVAEKLEERKKMKEQRAQRRRRGHRPRR